MQLGERQKAFEEAVKAHFSVTRRTKINQAFGVSNSAKVIEGGIQLGVPNLDKWLSDDVDAFILLCVIRFPPEDEVYFAIRVQSDIEKMSQRLTDMRRLGGEAKAKSAGTDIFRLEESEDTDELEYSARNNLVVTYLSQGGKLYFRNKGFWSSLKFDLSTVAPAIAVDGIAVSIYPPAASVRRSMLAREFVGYLGKFVGRQQVHELDVWPDAMSISPAMRRMPHTIGIATLREDIEGLGGHYVDGIVERFHEGANFLPHKHFVILSGLSGTGKTQLALQYARAVHGIRSMNDPDPLLKVCPVRPEWTDPSGLTGYHDHLTNKYIIPPFLEAVLLATAHRDSPVFVVLDEMNLARVEYYFADVLSAMESRGDLSLHSSGVTVEGSTGGEIRAETPFPANLFIIGTVNVDESTNPISDKVLDRAIVIDMSHVDLMGFMAKLSKRCPELAASAATLGSVLEQLNAELLPHACGFGYRVAEEIIRYDAFAARKLGRNPTAVLDDMLAQKVLVKLKGSHAQRGMLANLQRMLIDYGRSHSVVQRLAADLDELGSFRYGR